MKHKYLVPFYVQVGLVVVIVWALSAWEVKAEAPAVTTTTTTVEVTTTTTSTTTTVPPLVVPANALCPQWWNLAVGVGWAVEDLPVLDRVIYRESRCLPDAWNGHDAGLTQINQIHREFVAVMGWTYPDGMFNPRANLSFALKLWQGRGWKPWGF